MKHKFPQILSISSVILLLSAGFAAAQSTAAVDRLLAEDKATVADAAYLILAASNIVPETAAADKVMAALSERKLLEGRAAEDPITLGEASYLIMQTLGIKGGLLYTVFPGPRYAARELAYLRLVQGNTHPSRVVSGSEVMHILGGALELKGSVK